MLGEVIAGRYRIVDRLGSGGAGEVFVAEDLELPRKVALKFLAPGWGSDRRLRQRFLREAEALSALDHPHICTIYQAGETDDGRMFIAMAHYPGRDLRTVLAEGALPLEEALACAIAIADGMDKAHRKGFLHRDLKPANVMITEDGVVKILDFGLAKLSDRTQLTETGTTMGTLAYASPEQAAGEALDTRSDVYSLGVILYQMISGVCPFAAPSAAATLLKVLHEVPPPIGELVEGLPPELEELVRRAVEKDPGNRPASMDVFLKELLSILGAVSPARATRIRAEHVDASGHPAHPRRRRVSLPLAAALLVVVVAALSVRPIASRLGQAASPASLGIAVLPLGTGAGGSSDGPLAAGFWMDLTARTVRLADHIPGAWVLPPARAHDIDTKNGRDRAGIDRVIDGVARSDATGPVYEVRVQEAGTGALLASREFPLDGEGPAFADLTQWLAQALGTELEPATLATVDIGYTSDREAWRAWLRGAGELSADDPAELDAAIADFRHALALDPEFGRARVRLAEALFRKSRVDDDASLRNEALTLLESETAAATPVEESWALLASIHASKADWREAARLYRRAVDVQPAAVAPRFSLASARLKLDEPEAAERVYREACAANAGYYGAWEQLGYFLWTRDRIPEATQQFLRASELAPGHGRTYNYLGACYLVQDDWDNATRMFEKSIQIEHNFEACSNLGLLYYMAGRFQDAADMYEWAHNDHPGHHIPVGNLASARIWIPGQEEQALEDFREAIRLAEERLVTRPEDRAQTTASLAGYYVRIDPDRARELMEQALAMDPKDPEILYRAATLHEELGERLEALSRLGEAIRAGYSLKVITHEKLLEKLREDPRYRLLLP